MRIRVYRVAGVKPSATRLDRYDIQRCLNTKPRYIRYNVRAISLQSVGILEPKLVFCGRGGNITAHQSHASCRCFSVG